MKGNSKRVTGLERGTNLAGDESSEEEIPRTLESEIGLVDSARIKTLRG